MPFVIIAEGIFLCALLLIAVKMEVEVRSEKRRSMEYPSVNPWSREAVEL